MSQIPSDKKKGEIPPLLYPPLIESIFEVHWLLQEDKQTGRLRDPSYPMMYGSLYERLKKDFPFTEDLPASQVHPEASPYAVRHRIRKQKDGYPAIQVGPGIATVNMAKGYSWKEFSSLSLHLIESIAELFPKHTLPLQFMKAELRYLNGVPLGEQKENPLGFLEDRLHLRLGPSESLVREDQAAGAPNTVNCTLGYPLRRPNAVLGVGIHLGHMEEKPSYLFQIQVVSNGKAAPLDAKSFEKWFPEAHQAAGHCFSSLCKGSLMDQFCGA